MNKETLSLELADNNKEKSLFAIPLENLVDCMPNTLQWEILFGVLSPEAHAQWQKKHPDEVKKGHRIAFKLIEPDPWLIAMGYIMWQGIIQGLSWDVVKLSVKQALDKLFTAGLAPTKSKIKKSKGREIQAGFSWVKYGVDEKKQHEMFLGLKSCYERKSEKERKLIEDSVVKTRE